MSTTYLALLRGVNVGGRNKLPMKGLAKMFAEMGYGSVRTYVQSGNVIFRAAPDASARLSGLITAQIAKRFGVRTPVVLRTAEQLDAIICHNPFLKRGLAAETLHVLFLAHRPSHRGVSELDPDRSPRNSLR